MAMKFLMFRCSCFIFIIHCLCSFLGEPNVNLGDRIYIPQSKTNYIEFTLLLSSDFADNVMHDKTFIEFGFLIFFRKEGG